MTDRHITSLLQRSCTLGDCPRRRDRGGELYVSIPTQDLSNVVAALLNEGLVHHLTAISAQRSGDDCRVLYHFWRREEGITLEVHCDPEEPRVPSLTGRIAGANWYEREAAEMCGIAFVGHPDPAPLLLPDDWEGKAPLARGEEAP